MSNSVGAFVGDNICKTYYIKGQAPVQALKNCSFEFDPEKLNVVMGTSGCGKSTLANILAGYVRADQDSVTIDGSPVTGSGSDRLMVFQETALWPWMTQA